MSLRFRSTTFRKRGRVATAKVTFSNKSAPVLCKRNAVLLLFAQVAQAHEWLLVCLVFALDFENKFYFKYTSILLGILYVSG